MPDKIRISGDFYTTEDGFGYNKYAKTIVDMITDQGFPSPFTFGVFGEWGSGKTSLMRMIEEALSKGHSDFIVPVWFNPWRYEREPHLIVPFLKTIQHALSKHIMTHNTLPPETVRKLRLWKNKISGAAFALSSGFKGDLDVKFLNAKLEAERAVRKEEDHIESRKLNKKIKKLEQFSTMYHNVLYKLEEVYEEEPTNLRVVVFIDDLDRCLPEKAIEVLKGVKSFLDIPGYIFFIGIDRKVIEKGIRVEYKGFVIEDRARERAEGNGDQPNFDDIPITPSDYLEKIVQLPITLPPVESTRMEDYLRRLLHENESIKPYLDIIQSGLKQNPRTYKRFINTLAFHTKLAVEKGCLKTARTDSGQDQPLMTLELLVKWTILNFAFLDLVEAMKKRKLLIIELQDWTERLDMEKQEKINAVDNTERGATLAETPPHIRHWLSDGKLKTILRINKARGDTGFTKENIDLYVQMGEFTYTFLEQKESAQGPVIKTAAGHIEAIGKMIRIPKGEFLYGKDNKTVLLDEYEIGIYPVTNAEYKEFVDDSKYGLPEHWDREKRTYPEGKNDHPVVNVSFEDASAYCKWKAAQDKDKFTYRLPTEEEFEKAARGSDGREYPWGDDFDAGKCNTEESGTGDTTPVDKFPEGVSPYGCFDTAGNIWEWSSSDYESVKGTKVVRGGSWNFNQLNARCTTRYWFRPGFRTHDAGFRCVRTLQKPWQ
ncbi:MAG: hypothetical protein C4560_07055 [Nitrospiraceae bacterium]|nr:MAG: hypothetical protein C4560_07055 [Nitrospiraceae bacterium]